MTRYLVALLALLFGLLPASAVQQTATPLFTDHYVDLGAGPLSISSSSSAVAS